MVCFSNVASEIFHRSRRPQADAVPPRLRGTVYLAGFMAASLSRTADEALCLTEVPNEELAAIAGEEQDLLYFSSCARCSLNRHHPLQLLPPNFFFALSSSFPVSALLLLLLL